MTHPHQASASELGEKINQMCHASLMHAKTEKQVAALVARLVALASPPQAAEPEGELLTIAYMAGSHDRRKTSEQEIERLRAQLLAAEADAERKQRHAALGAAIERAAAELPDGWMLHVSVERGAGWATLENEKCEEVTVEEVDSDNRLTDEIHAAIDAALSPKAPGGATEGEG